LAGKVEEAGSDEDVLGSFLAAIESTEPMHKQPSGVLIPPTKEFILGALGIGLGSLPARLTDTQASDAIESYIGTLKNFLPMAADVGEGLKALSAKLTESQAEKMTQGFFTATKEARRPEELASFAMGLSALRVKFDDSQAKEVVAHFLAVIKRVAPS
jgi:hypothetical protein